MVSQQLISWQICVKTELLELNDFLGLNTAQIVKADFEFINSNITQVKSLANIQHST